MKISESQVRKIARIAALKQIKSRLIQEVGNAPGDSDDDTDDLVNVDAAGNVLDSGASEYEVERQMKMSDKEWQEREKDRLANNSKSAQDGSAVRQGSEADAGVDFDGDGQIEDEDPKKDEPKKPKYLEREVKDRMMSELKSQISLFSKPVTTISRQQAMIEATKIYQATANYAGEEYVRVIGIGLGTDKDAINRIFSNPKLTCADLSRIADEFQKKYGGNWNNTPSLSAVLAQELDDGDFYANVEGPINDKMNDAKLGGFVRWGGEILTKNEFFDLMSGIQDVSAMIPGDTDERGFWFAGADAFGMEDDYVEIGGGKRDKDGNIIIPSGDQPYDWTPGSVAKSALAQQVGAGAIQYGDELLDPIARAAARGTGEVIDDKVIDFATGKPVTTPATKGSRLARAYTATRGVATKVPVVKTVSTRIASMLPAKIAGRAGFGPVGVALLANDLVNWFTNASITGDVNQVLSEELWSGIQQAHDQVLTQAKIKLKDVELIPYAEESQEKPGEKPVVKKKKEALAAMGISELSSNADICTERIQKIMNAYVSINNVTYKPYKAADKTTGPDEFPIEEDGDFGPMTVRLWRAAFCPHVFKTHPTFSKLGAFSQRVSSGTAWKWKEIHVALQQEGYPGYTFGIRGQLAFCIDAYNGDNAYGEQSHGTDMPRIRRKRRDRATATYASNVRLTPAVEQEVTRSQEKPPGKMELPRGNYNTAENVVVEYEPRGKVSIGGKDYHKYKSVREFNNNLANRIASALINSMVDQRFWQGTPGNEIRKNKETYNLSVSLGPKQKTGKMITVKNKRGKEVEVPEENNTVRVAKFSGFLGGGRFEKPEAVIADAISAAASNDEMEALSKGRLIITFPYGTYPKTALEDDKRVNEARDLAKRLIRRSILKKILK